MNRGQARTLSNQADHYNAEQARAAEKGPMHLITFWTNVCRKLAKDALEKGDPSLAEAYAAHCHDFYQRHTQSP
ncbi:hypothetical protein [Streptomyces sp. MZ04]|uniref:hypothetical protein n=1 Tax=Streptomyces sp. MZ04 TaxID=2559236 RepID=UPI00107EAF72|nr:hypothetical protein [Streptomyces sp. MZ04]TGB06546.1 hypothetical protein E2651_23325 [Streptomyces sp. MZ04]